MSPPVLTLVFNLQGVKSKLQISDSIKHWTDKLCAIIV